jgi:hypothetical protein
MNHYPNKLEKLIQVTKDLEEIYSCGCPEASDKTALEKPYLRYGVGV